jgi:hypothetical protein
MILKTKHEPQSIHSYGIPEAHKESKIRLLELSKLNDLVAINSSKWVSVESGAECNSSRFSFNQWACSA